MVMVFFICFEVTLGTSWCQFPYPQQEATETAEGDEFFLSVSSVTSCSFLLPYKITETNSAEKCFPLTRRIRIMAKTTCPISRSDFRSHARPVPVKVNEVPWQSEVKEFSTGS